MRVNEVEELLQISRANIRFYEKEGLLHPKRSSNGYRSYSSEDVAVLKEIIIFRKLGLSLAEIRDVLEGKVSVSEALFSNAERLQEQIEELNGALNLWAVILWMYSKRGIFPPAMGEESIKAHLPKKAKGKVLCFSAAAYLAVVVIYANWYSCVTEEGVEVHHFFLEREYTWEDADYYTLEPCFDGVLRYTVRMKDGTSIVCLGSAVALENGDEELLQNLTVKFAEKGIPLKVKDWDKLMRRLKYDYWEEFAGELRKLAGE